MYEYIVGFNNTNNCIERLKITQMLYRINHDKKINLLLEEYNSHNIYVNDHVKYSNFKIITQKGLFKR